jgi:hypothetical protein
MLACHLLAISLRPARRLRGSSLVDARGEPRLARVKWRAHQWQCVYGGEDDRLY